jgi:hypothetical protein
MTADLARYERLIQRILEHPRYAPAMENAVADGAKLVLDYHSHRGDGHWCVSICEKQEGAIEVLDVGLGNLRELVHIEGFGRDAESCLPLCGDLATALERHYGLRTPPLVYRDGKPLADSGGAEPANGGGAR